MSWLGLLILECTIAQERVNTAYRLPQWERHPKVVVLLYREERMC